jgi:protocatechuate 3,4-dioxygenase beta subunit
MMKQAHDFEEDDDKPIGRLLTRREMLALLGGTGLFVVAGSGLTRIALAQDATATAEATAVVPSCIVKPALTEGPYFVDDQLNRSDIRIEPSDGSIREGAMLKLAFRVTQLDSAACIPLPGAQVDVWHCDAEGAYSGVADPGFSTEGEKWLRGYQITDESGLAEFVTIYPGWYSGRAVHIHFKIRTDPEAEAGYEFTSQLFFPEDLTDIVHAQPPYDAKGYRNTLNENDNIYGQTGDQLLLNITEDEDGYVVVFDIALDLSADPVEDPMAGGGNGGPGGRPPQGGPRGGNGAPPGGPAATQTLGT